MVKAVDGVDLECLRRPDAVPVWAKAVAAKSIMARSILRIVDAPGRIVEGSIVYRCRRWPDGRSGHG